MKNRLLTMIWLAAGAGLLCGCGDDADGEASFEEKVTVQRGVAGFLISGCDVSDCESKPIVGWTVEAYADSSPGATEPFEPSGTALGGDDSDGDGFYEIELPPGDYGLVASEGVQTKRVTTGEGVTRCDFESGPGGGFWSCK